MPLDSKVRMSGTKFELQIKSNQKRNINGSKLEKLPLSDSSWLLVMSMVNISKKAKFKVSISLTLMISTGRKYTICNMVQTPTARPHVNIRAQNFHTLEYHN